MDISKMETDIGTIKEITKSINNICSYHQGFHWYSLRKNILKRSNAENIIINKNVRIFFENIQMINFYGKLRLLKEKIYLKIRNVLIHLLKIDIHPFCLLINDYLVPSYDTFYIRFPSILHSTFFNSELNTKKITIFIIRLLILNYEDIIKYCPILYNNILLILNEYTSIKWRGEEKTFSLNIIKEVGECFSFTETINKSRSCVCNSILKYILISLKDTCFEEKKDMLLVEENLRKIIKDVLKMFIPSYN